MSQRRYLQIPPLRSGWQKKERRVLWYPTQANRRLEWGTQPSLPAKNAGHPSLKPSSAYPHPVTPPSIVSTTCSMNLSSTGCLEISLRR